MSAHPNKLRVTTMPARPLSPDAQEALDRLIEQVATLWPYLHFKERYEWARRVTWATGVYPEGRWFSIGMPLIAAEIDRLERLEIA